MEENATRGVVAITDAVSAQGYFPAWHRYYARQVGAENIVLVTCEGMARHFAGYALGRIHELPGGYNDDRRLAAINSIAADLVAGGNWLLRADSDEFIVADPRRYGSLREYLQRCTQPYVTARGFDVVQAPQERALDTAAPMLVEQRRVAFALAALNKTCVTRVPLQWGRGFHHCNAYPTFDDLYLFHLKRADIQFQKLWALHMMSRIEDDEYARRYYEDSIDTVDVFHRQRFDLPTLGGDALYHREEFDARYFASLRQDERTKEYAGDFILDSVNVEIPSAFRGLL